MDRPCYCYIVECADGTYYTGWTVDPERRVATHNTGRGARYTRMRLPVKLVYLEEQPDRKTAMKRERAIKKMTRESKKNPEGFCDPQGSCFSLSTFYLIREQWQMPQCNNILPLGAVAFRKDGRLRHDRSASFIDHHSHSL